jgi:hypothetical protein
MKAMLNHPRPFLSSLLGYVTTLLTALSLTSCNFDKEIELNLPSEAGELFVECYLRQGERPLLTLTRTQGYFDSISAPRVANASVVIRGSNGYYDSLSAGLVVDQANNKFYNYFGKNNIDLVPGQTFTLTCRTTTGEVLTGITTVEPKVIIDSIQQFFSPIDSSAYIVAWYPDAPNRTDYYRFLISKDSISNELSLAFAYQDNFRDGTQSPIRSGYIANEGDSLFIRLYHIEQSYFDFLNSVRAAQNSNGNPFAQPASLKSTVMGGMGVFTSLVYDDRKLLLKK